MKIFGLFGFTYYILINDGKIKWKLIGTTYSPPEDMVHYYYVSDSSSLSDYIPFREGDLKYCHKVRD